MRIYAVADIHGRTDRFQRIRQKAAETEADVLVMAGDIGGLFSQKRAVREMDRMPIPVLAVRGNSDRKQMETDWHTAANISSLHLRKVFFQDIAFSGIGGTFLLPFESRLRFSEKSYVSNPYSFFQDVAVMVVHPPPRGVLDKAFGRFHSGSPAVRELVLRNKPSLLLCGHIHENTGWGYLRNTLIVNCSIGRSGSGAVVDFDGQKPADVRLLD